MTQPSGVQKAIDKLLTDYQQMAGSGMRQTLLPRATQVKNIWVPFGEGVGPK